MNTHIVFGASGGVGSELSRRLLRWGDRVLLAGRDESKVKALSDELDARLGEPRDVASMIAWLLDPSQSWVTGQVFGVDGGLGTVRTRS